MSAQDVQLLPEVRLPVPTCSTLQQPDLGACTTQTQSGDNSPRQAFVSCTHPRPRPIPCSEPSVVGSCLIKTPRACHPTQVSAKLGDYSQQWVERWWQFTESIQSNECVTDFWLISISSQVHEKVLQPHLEVLMRFKCFEINWDGMQGLVSERIWSGLASCGHLYRLPSHNENVKRSTIAKDPRGHFHDAFIHVAVNFE